jgi:hypothetical protein
MENKRINGQLTFDRQRYYVVCLRRLRGSGLGRPYPITRVRHVDDVLNNRRRRPLKGAHASTIKYVSIISSRELL